MTERNAVVTGGGTGIGRAVARRLAGEGCSVVIVGRRKSVLDDAAAAISSETGAAVHAEQADVTSPDDVADVAARVGERWDALDVLVHNAGGTTSGDTSTLPGLAADWLASYNLNVVSAVVLTSALQERLRRPGGRIVAVSSVAGLRGGGSYGAAKAAINLWVTELAGHLAPDGITVNAVAPGFIPDTEFWDGRRSEQVVQSRVAMTPVGRPGTPDEVAALVAHLASPDAGFTTGQVIGIHGGMVLARL